MMKKTCSSKHGCGQEKNIEEFNKSKKGYRFFICKECNKKRLNKLYQDNKLAISERNKQRYENNKQILSEKNKKYYKKNKKEITERQKKYFKKLSIEKKLFRQSIKRAKVRNLDHNIQLEDIQIPEYCPVLGIKIVPNTGNLGPSYNSPTIDRIDNSKGYVKGNIKIISHRANSLKKDSTIEEIEKIIKYMKNEL